MLRWLAIIQGSMLEASGLQLPREGAQRHNGPELDPGAVARHRYHNTSGPLDMHMTSQLTLLPPLYLLPTTR